MKYILTTLAVALLSHCAQSKQPVKNPSGSAKQQTAIKDSTQAGNNGILKNADYTCKDSIAATDLVKKACRYYQNKIKEGDKPQEIASQTIIYIARQLIGKPYVAKTLEKNNEENIVVNLSGLDCTTYVETVLAAYLCAKQNTPLFVSYLENLKTVRYVNGTVSYPTRQHYFTEWIEDNTKDGIVKEVQAPNLPFDKTQTIAINFMSTHAELYPMMKNREDYIRQISDMEKRLSGRTYKYISKESIRNNATFRKAIHDGDIIAITTKKKGLDTSHIGIAVWHKDGLHMLNASQIHKKVVEEPMTLYQYMQKHPSQEGIRIIRILP